MICKLCGKKIEDHQSRVFYWGPGEKPIGYTHRTCRDAHKEQNGDLE